MYEYSAFNRAIKIIFSKIIPLLLLIAVLAFPLAGCAGTTKTPAPSTQKKEEPKKKEKDKYIKAGMYKVGTDIKAGEYLLYSEGIAAYFQVSKDSSGAIESIINNDNFQGTRYVTVKDGQYLEIKGSKMLPVSESPVQNSENGKYKEGMYKVGRDIKAGEYKVVSSGATAYYEVASNSGGGIESIVANDNFNGEKYISIKDGQYIKLNSCTITVK